MLAGWLRRLPCQQCGDLSLSPLPIFPNPNRTLEVACCGSRAEVIRHGGGRQLSAEMKRGGELDFANNSGGGGGGVKIDLLLKIILRKTLGDLQMAKP